MERVATTTSVGQKYTTWQVRGREHLSGGEIQPYCACDILDGVVCRACARCGTLICSIVMYIVRQFLVARSSYFDPVALASMKAIL